LATLLVRAHANADLLASKQVPEFVSVLMDAKVPGVHQAVRGMCLDDVRSIQLQHNAVLTPIESREQLFLRGNRIDFQLVALRRVSRFGNMAMRQARSSQDVDHDTLERHHAALFGDVDDRVDSRSYKERYDALHSAEHTSLVPPEPPSLRATPLLSVTAVIGLCGAVLLFVSPRVAPLVRLRAAEVRYRCSRMPPESVEADVARAVDSLSAWSLVVAYLRRRWLGQETFAFVAAEPVPSPVAVESVSSSSPNQKKQKKAAASASSSSSAAKNDVSVATTDRSGDATHQKSPKKTDNKPKKVEKQPPVNHGNQGKKNAKQTKEKQQQEEEQVRAAEQVEPIVVEQVVVEVPSPQQKKKKKNSDAKHVRTDKVRSVSPDVTQETNSASATPPAPATPRADSPTETASSTRSELDPADGNGSVSPINVVPLPAEQSLSAAPATAASDAAAAAVATAPLVADAVPLGAPPGIGDSMRHRAVLPASTAPPVLAANVASGSMFTQEQLWEQQRLLELQRLQLQQLFFNLRGVSDPNAVPPLPAPAPPPMLKVPRETLGDVFNTNLFFLTEEPAAQAQQHHHHQQMKN
jgi:hypothetical protein